MFPRTHKGERKYRLKKRQLEIGSILHQIKLRIHEYPMFSRDELNILEFGCGNGFQIPYLKQLGKVTGTDISIERGSDQPALSDLVECDISNAPFEDDQFDLVFSNHVIEHIRNLDPALNEVKRIGKKECLYAFSVPTNIWLVFSLPAQYLQKIRGVFKLLNRPHSSTRPRAGSKSMQKKPPVNDKKTSLLRRWIDKIIPHGHGRIRNFYSCYQAFKIQSWQNLFEKKGFEVICTKPLLLYAPSEWPVIPMKPVNDSSRICSSVLFLMRQKQLPTGNPNS